jgi:hypothetical protein
MIEKIKARKDANLNPYWAMLWINCPIFQPCSVPCLAPNIPVFRTHHTCELLTDNDDINMQDSSSVGHRRVGVLI